MFFLEAGGRVDLGSKLLNEDLLTSRIHSEDVLGAVEDHLTQSMPGGMAAKNSAALQQTVLLPQFNLGQAYAMTIQYGYVLRRAQSRLQLERSLHPSREGLDSLRSYLKRRRRLRGPADAERTTHEVDREQAVFWA